jgi:hypothetical protein
MNNELMKLIKSVQPTGRMGNNNEPVWNAEKVYGLMVKAQQQVNSVDLADVGGSLLRETTMRANLALPENDQDLKWFDETCDHKKSGDFMERLFDELKLGKQ